MKRKVEKAGLVIKPHAPNIENILVEVRRLLEAKGIACILEEVASLKLGEHSGIRREDLPARVDLVVVLGGDGTLLSIAAAAARSGVPVLGVNLGRLGFLTEVSLDEMSLAVDVYLAGGEEIVSSRSLLEATHKGQAFHCLNDVVINKGAVARMIQLALWIDDKEIAVLKADGLIISTTTGSTAYALSAGGPIVHPLIPAVVLAPICPHTFTFRPMVVSSESRIRTQLLTAGEEVYLTLDGQRGVPLAKNDIIEAARSRLELQLISSPGRNYFDLIRDKLGWGVFK